MEIMSCESLGTLDLTCDTSDNTWGSSQNLNRMFSSYETTLNEYCREFANWNLSTKARTIGTNRDGTPGLVPNAGTWPVVPDLEVWKNYGIEVAPTEYEDMRYAVQCKNDLEYWN